MATTTSDPFVGTLVDGRYEVVSRIARGGMATVYLAVDRRLDRNVALKIMHAHLVDGVEGAEFVSRFRREARAAARLTHPGLVGVYDQGFDGETSYLTMEYVPGTNLRARLRDERTLSLGETLRLLEEILDSLAAAHRAGLVHRDIKPENVLLTEDEHVKLADFGLARAVTEVAATATGTVLGTVAYLSPEVITTGRCDARTDVYSVGVLAYEMLLGKHPHTGSTPIQVAFEHVNSDIPAPSRSAWWMPIEVDELVCSLAARDPDDRPRDAAAALALVRQTRRMLSDADLERRADPPAAVVTEGPSGPVGAPSSDDVVADAGTTLGPDDDASDVSADEAREEREGAGDTAGDDDEGSLDAIPTAVFGNLGTGTRVLARDELGSGTTRGELPVLTNPVVPAHDVARKRKRRRRRWVWALVLVLAVVGVFGFWTWWMSSGPGAYTVVPTGIVGTSADDADTALESVGLRAHQTKAFDDVVPDGDVVSVNPGEGDKIRKDGTVEVTVSQGIENHTVPAGLVGKTKDAALASLAKSGFDAVPTPVEDYSDKVPEGHVISVSVDAGTSVPHNSPIQVVVSDGPAPVTVPQVKGSDQDDAVATLKSSGLVPQVTKQYSDDVPEGTVISQDPQQSTTLHRGDTVALTVSRGPEMVVVPSVTGKHTAEAKKLLEAKGFKVKVNKFLGGVLNTVRFQDPDGKKKAPKGSTVSLTVF
ncbi:Stk1 family PASTA domain-containing Ser/Thr kinase [Luteimicrobium xylanilyticum]|uniref:non-specific serine/threonine protein kinase n=1 Tax=Luteimicrobium xylanilyticum TaxID=1133546 RepID=A0A5P9QDL4_9MICO|nr:Stk1 family PASTA domain-containing Ser/Thr kinase [Luteimicrobium xylanilyticum]QFU98565.1 Non-specific serine/threonine protein kinase [Luteimicrobium xylanilyticum]